MRYAVAFVAALGLAGCSSIQVHTARAPNAPLEQVHTFAFMQPTPGSRAERLDQSPAGQQIHNQITADLENKGYTPAPPGMQPDFVVAYRVNLRERTAVDTWDGSPGPWGWGWGWGWGGWAWGGPDVTVRQWTEGSLVVDFVDPRTEHVLWRGTADSTVEHPTNPNLEKVAKAVDKMMNKYPPAAMASGERTRM